MRATTRTRRKPPKNASEGSAWVRRYLIDLYDRRDGEAADWQLIAETAFKVGLDAIDAAPASPRRAEMLIRLHAAAYDRLTGVSPELQDCNMAAASQKPVALPLRQTPSCSPATT